MLGKPRKSLKKCIAHVVSIKLHIFWVFLIFGPLDKLHHFHDPLRSGSTSLQEPQKCVGFGIRKSYELVFCVVRKSSVHDRKHDDNDDLHSFVTSNVRSKLPYLAIMGKEVQLTIFNSKSNLIPQIYQTSPFVIMLYIKIPFRFEIYILWMVAKTCTTWDARKPLNNMG